jgi:hypothetical protein
MPTETREWHFMSIHVKYLNLLDELEHTDMCRQALQGLC